MSTQIQRRRGTTAEHSTFTGVEGELTVDTTKDTAVVHDGTTVGGHPLQKQYPPLGSAAAPTYTFTGDTNTGIYSPGADQVAVATNGTGRLFVDANGNIAVGTSTTSNFGATSRSFDINAAGGIANLYVKSGAIGGGLMADAGNGYVQLWTSTSHPIAFNIAFSEKMRLDTSGRLGIGTSAPNELLEVRGTENQGIRLTSTASSGEGANLQWYSEQSGDNKITAEIESDGSGTGGNLSFRTRSTAGILTDRVLIDNAGRVGIGTTSPGAALEVINTTGKISARATTGVSSLALQIYNNGTDSYIDSTAYGAGSGGGIAFRRNGTVEMGRFDTSGRLLVGTSSARGQLGITPGVQSEGTNFAQGTLALTVNSNSGAYPLISLARSGGTSLGSNTIVSNGDIVGKIFFTAADGVDMASAVATIEAVIDGTPGSDDLPGRLVFSTTADGASSPTERMRITQDGKVSIGLATPGGNGPLQVYNGNSSQGVGFVASDGAGNEWHFGRSNVNGYFYVVRQTGTGMYMNTNSWVATSDQRAKQDIADIESTIDLVKALKPSRFNWKADGSADVGFIAQQVQPLIPEAVVDSGDPDAMLGITQDKLLPFVVKALQEAVAKIESLEARLTAAGV
jgi:hypothetical protein